MITRKAEKACDEPFDDMVCWQQLKNDDRQGLKDLYVRYSPELFRYGMAVQPDRELIKDCIQELFIDLWKYRKNLRDTDNIKVYLCRSLSNKIYRELHLTKRRQNHNPSEVLASLYPLDSRSSENLADKSEEKIHQLYVAIEKLPDRQRELIQHVYFKKLSSEEVSEKMGIGVQSVYTLTWKAIRKLKKSLVSFLI